MKDTTLDSSIFQEHAARQLVETMNEGLVWLDDKHYIVYVNSQFCRISGFNKNELLGKPYLDFILPESSEHVSEQLMERKSGYSGRYEAFIKTKDNTRSYVLVSPRAIFNEEGEFSGSFALFTDITERKQMEEDLRVSQIKYSILFNASPVGITLSGFYDGKFEAVNERFCNIVDYTSEELVGKSSIELGLWVNASERSMAVKKAEVDGAVQDYEIHFYTKKGDIRICQLYSEVITINENKFVLSNILDVTEKTYMYQELQYSEEKFSRAFHASPEAMSINSLYNGKYEEVNESFCQVTGYSRDEVIGKSTVELEIWANPVQRKEMIHKLVEGRVVQQHECDFRKKDGTVGTGLFSAEMIHFDGRSYVLSSVLDITQRKKAEEALNTQKERLRVTLQSIGDAVISTDIRGNIIMMNQAAEKLTAWTQSETANMKLKDIFNIVDEGTGKKPVNPVEKVLNTGEIIKLTNHTVLISKDGRKRIITYNAAPIKDEDNTIFGVILVFRDVTEKIRIENEWNKLQKFEALELLAGGIAHDFNNIMTAIMGNVSVLQKYLKENTMAMERLEDVATASTRARELTRGLLTFARDGLPVRRKADIKEIIRECVDISLTGSSVKVQYSMPDDIWPVSIDATRMGQVFQNLAINAVQAMPEGGILTIELENSYVHDVPDILVEPGRYILIKVIDNGKGIPAAVLPRIFDPYYTTKEHGSGLGLATVHSIVLQHNGYIRVESSINTGTTFTIWLPGCQKDQDDHSHTTGYEVNKLQVLIMDDDEMVLEIGREIFSELGHDVECFDSFKDLEERYRDYRKNNIETLVIMDMIMPGQDDIQSCLKKLKKIDPDVIACITSGYTDDEKMLNPREYGFAGAIPKPYRIKDIETLIDMIGTQEE